MFGARVVGAWREAALSIKRSVYCRPRRKRRPDELRERKMTQVMKGVRILEVAQFTFVPAAGAVLADWGADVIKIEHPVRGDTQRGFVNVGGQKVDPNRFTLMENTNRGKPSFRVAVETLDSRALP